MADYVWPSRADSTVIGKPTTKLDAIPKSTGMAKYAYDVNPDKMLLARALGCPHAHCKIKSLDTSAAEKVPGVVKVSLRKKAGDEIVFQGDILGYVVGETEGAVAEGLKAIKGDYELLDVWVDDEDLAGAQKAGRQINASGGAARGFTGQDKAVQDEELEKIYKQAAAVVKGRYGCQAITHMCLEPHGGTMEWKDGKLTATISSQSIWGAPRQFASGLNVGAEDVTTLCEYIGGGFGSKFQVDYWMVDGARLSREIGRPVKIMLDRDQELKIAGCRPSGFADVTVAADKDGLLLSWDSHQWSTGGTASPLGAGEVPYVISPKLVRKTAVGIRTNTGSSRAWRAPNHPQACALSQTALDDVAAKLGLDSLEVFRKNLENVANQDRRKVYAAEMDIAAKLIDWKAKWHAHGKGSAQGSIVNGLGMAIHTWRGGGNANSCRIVINPEGGVEAYIGTQDLGTGTRTIFAQVVAETFGLPLDGVRVHIGSSKYPQGSASGGSATTGSVCVASRTAALNAFDELAKQVAPKLNTEPGNLIAKNGRIQDKNDATKSLSWKEACSALGMGGIDMTSAGQPGRGTGAKLSSDGVGGVVMAEVAVDRDTGVIKMKKFVCVQDCGLIINPKTAKSQVYGAMIMGVCSGLFEERIMDKSTGAFLNCEIADYKLARLGDIGEFVVEMYEPDSERARGVIGLGEPPTVGPMTAISNAVCNALGVRVPVLPMTPKRVLDALKARNA